MAELVGCSTGRHRNMFKPPPKHIFSMSLCMNELYMSLRHLAEVHISISTATTTCSYITTPYLATKLLHAHIYN